MTGTPGCVMIATPLSGDPGPGILGSSSTRNGGAVSGAPGRCARAAVVASAAAACFVLSGLPVDVASADPGADPGDVTMSMAAAAAVGAGHAATDAMADVVTSGMIEIGRVAADVPPPVLPPKA